MEEASGENEVVWKWKLDQFAQKIRISSGKQLHGNRYFFFFLTDKNASVAYQEPI